MKQLVEKGITIDSRTLPILYNGALDDTQGSTFQLQYERQRLEGMVSVLRQMKDANRFKQYASQYRNQMDQSRAKTNNLKACNFLKNS